MTTISEFKNRVTTKPSPVYANMDGDAFRQMVLGWKPKYYGAKEKAPMFSMCDYGPKGTREKDNIKYVTAIVLDIDGGNSEDKITAALKKLASQAYCCYETYSHTSEDPKVRIIVPLVKPVTAGEYESQELALRMARYLSLKVDICCARSALAYYMPSLPTRNAERGIIVGDATAFFDVALLPAEAAKPAKASSLKGSKDQLEIYEKLDTLKKNMYGNVSPIFCSEKINIYDGAGVWHPVDPDKTFCKAIIEHHHRKIGIADAQELLNAMKIMYACDQFPIAKSNKITLENGTLDTDTGKLNRHSEKNYHRSGMAFDYDPDAKCELWLKTLNDIFLPDEDKDLKIRFLQEWLGYLLTPSTKYQVMVWMYGGGANGKSVITHVARELLGTANVSSVPLSQLSARFIGAELDGKLANIVDEIATDALLKEDEIKKIVSGDPIQVERKNKDPYFFCPTARIFAATNSLPYSKDSTHGLDRRLLLLTCNRTFAPHEMDRDLISKLKLELPGIFVWALEGMARLKAQDKFTEVPSCVAAMDDFKVSRNSVALFKRDCLEMPGINSVAVGGGDKAYRVQGHELYKVYKAYCAANTYQAFGNEGFGKKLKELGVEQIRPGGKRHYVAKTVNLEEAGIVGERYPGPRTVSINDEFGEQSAAE
jgi:putative DNA primase/helicase